MLHVQTLYLIQVLTLFLLGSFVCNSLNNIVMSGLYAHITLLISFKAHKEDAAISATALITQHQID